MVSSLQATGWGSPWLTNHIGWRWWRQHRQLTLLLAYREIADRFAGSAIGVCWALIHPLLLMGILTVVFTFVFRLRFPAATFASGIDSFPIFFIAGYLPWMTVQDILVRSCTAVSDQRNLVKQVVFPVEVLPVRSVLAASVPQLIGHLFLVVLTLSLSATLPWTYLFLPLLFGVQLIGMIGLSLWLSALAVFVRDIREVMTALVTAGLYLLPILYIPDQTPRWLSWLLCWNPFSHLIWAYRDCLVAGRIEHPISWLIVAVSALLLFSSGCRLFGKLKPYFGNCL